MKRDVLYRIGLCAIVLFALMLPVSAIPSVVSSGITYQETQNGPVMGPKTVFTPDDQQQWITGWIQIPHMAAFVDGNPRYYYKYNILKPNGMLYYGMADQFYGFDSNDQGTAIFQVGNLLQDNWAGQWTIEFYIHDISTGQDTHVADTFFTLTDSPHPATTTATIPAATQTAAVTGTTVPVATTLTTVPATTATPAQSGSIQVHSVPTGATVSLDDTAKGITPITLYSVPVGTHTVLVHTKGYNDYVTQVQVADQKMVTLDVTLVPSGAVQPATTQTSPPPVQTTALPATTTAATPATKGCPATCTSVYAEDRTLSPGSVVTIPIMICNAQDLANMDLGVTYDPSVLKFRSAVKGGLNANSLFDSNMVSNGNLAISFASSSGMTGSASIAILSFDVIGQNGSTSPITITVKTASTGSGSAITVGTTPGKFITGTPVTPSFDGGPVTARDALAALQMAVGKIPTDMKYDVTKDGSVNSADARAILVLAVSAP